MIGSQEKSWVRNPTSGTHNYGSAVAVETRLLSAGAPLHGKSHGEQSRLLLALLVPARRRDGVCLGRDRGSMYVYVVSC